MAPATPTPVLNLRHVAIGSADRRTVNGRGGNVRRSDKSDARSNEHRKNDGTHSESPLWIGFIQRLDARLVSFRLAAAKRHDGFSPAPFSTLSHSMRTFREPAIHLLFIWAACGTQRTWANG
jgi:hypothetical protein